MLNFGGVSFLDDFFGQDWGLGSFFDPKISILAKDGNGYLHSSSGDSCLVVVGSALPIHVPPEASLLGKHDCQQAHKELDHQNFESL